MSILANITEAAAAFLLDAADYRDLGLNLTTLDDRAIARELETEGLGSVMPECLTHGIAEFVPCDTGDVGYVFVINDAGQSWLVDAGKLED